MTCQPTYLAELLQIIGFFTVLAAILIGPVFLTEWLKRRFP